MSTNGTSTPVWISREPGVRGVARHHQVGRARARQRATAEARTASA